MKKLLSILFVFAFAISLASIAIAQTSTGTPATSTNSTSTRSVRLPVDLPCMQTATETRDNAIIAAENTAHTAAVSALTTRRDALKTAWGMTNMNERIAARNAAWKAYSTAIRAAQKDFRTARKVAWKKFNTDGLACRAKQADRSEGQGHDEKLW